eukprot:IDg11178t1
MFRAQFRIIFIFRNALDSRVFYYLNEALFSIESTNKIQ